MAATRIDTATLAFDASASSADVDAAIERLRADVERAVRRVCPRWLADHVDDLTQIVTTRIMQRVRETADTSVVLTSGYLYRAAYTVLVDEIRRRRRLNEGPIETDFLPASNVEDPERRATSRVIREAVAKCLAALAIPRRRAVVLRLQGHSFDEISAMLEWPLKKAHNLVYRGLADLRTCLTARGIAP